MLRLQSRRGHPLQPLEAATFLERLQATCPYAPKWLCADLRVLGLGHPLVWQCQDRGLV